MVLPVAMLTAIMIGVGLLVTRVFAHHWPFTMEDQLVLALVAARTPAWTTVTHAFSLAGYTIAIVVVTVVIAVALRIVQGRWHESLFLASAVSSQGLVFLLTTIAINRARPAVLHLDVSPPTSSFPSGHTSAALALYVGIALLLSAHMHRKSLAAVVCIPFCAVPVAVAISRMYLGMHHLSDTLASLVNGAGCLWIMHRAWLARPPAPGAAA